MTHVTLMSNTCHIDVQNNDTCHIDVQHNDTCDIDVQLNDTCHIDVQPNNSCELLLLYGLPCFLCSYVCYFTLDLAALENLPEAFINL